jgi:hypothetical protein
MSVPIKFLYWRRMISLLVMACFFITSLNCPVASAQDFRLPAPGAMVHLSPGFNPPILKGIKVHPENPFRFDFILDKGDSQLGNDQLKDESSKLIKYFLASLTIPEKDLWVNLSPYEKDRIIPNGFGLTEMGRDLLTEDYMLKQITASLIYPEDEIGKKFWKRVYEEAAKRYGTTNIPVNTFNKVWIVPEKAMVYENAKAGTAYVVESKLKVMLEQDYLALSKNECRGGFCIRPITGPTQGRPLQNDVNALGSQIVREIIIPELTKEVNEGKNFAQLRQVYNSLILATWYKKKIKDSILEQVYADKNKISGVNIDDPKETQKIYQRYLQAFKKGVYNYIKEEQDSVTQQMIPRKYFSGGVDCSMFGDITDKALVIADNKAILPVGINDNAVIIKMEANPADKAMLNGLIPQSVINEAVANLTDSITKNVHQNSAILMPEDYAGQLVSPVDGKTFTYSGKLERTSLEQSFIGLPGELRNKIKGKASWPVDTTSQPFYIASYYEFPTAYHRPYNFEGIAIQTAAGTPVVAVQGGRIMVEKVVERLNVFGSANVYIQTPDKMLWVYENIDINSIPKKFFGAMRTGQYYMLYNPELANIDDIEVEEGETIGNVMSWDSSKLPTPKSVGREVPSEVRKIFGDRYDHIYLRAYYNPDLGIKSITNEGLQSLRTVDPLLLFKLLGNFKLPWDGSLKIISLPSGKKVVLNPANEVVSPEEQRRIKKFHKIDLSEGSGGKTDYLDYAMASRQNPVGEKEKYIGRAKNGGIDLTPANMNLQTQNVGEGIKFHIDPVMLQQLQNAHGFVPVIISIQPMTDLKNFLGLAGMDQTPNNV